jgi:hypothetical protein
MSKPSYVPLWSETDLYPAGTFSTGTPTKVAPGSYRNAGHRRGVAPLAQFENHDRHYIGRWCKFVDEEVLSNAGGTFTLEAPITIAGGSFLIGAGVEFEISGALSLAPGSTTLVRSSASWEFLNVPLFSNGATFKNTSADDMLVIDADDGEIRFRAGGNVDFQNGFLLTGGNIDFGPGGTSTVRTTLTFSGAGALDGPVALTGSGQILERSADVATGNQALSIANGTIFYAGATSAADNWTFANPPEETKITVNAYAVVSPTGAINFKNAGGSTIVQLGNFSAGQISAAVLQFVAGAWRVLIREVKQ